MFSNFKLPLFLQRFTSSSDSDEYSCAGSANTNSQSYMHSMSKFYEDFVVLGQQNKLKSIFSKKITNTFFNQNDTKSEKLTNINNPAQTLYLRKKQPNTRFIEIDKHSYDHIGFRLFVVNEKQKEDLQVKLSKQIEHRNSVKKSVICRNVQFPVNYFIEEVNSICSKYACVLLVFKRCDMGIMNRMNQVIAQCQSASLNQTKQQRNARVKNELTQEKKPISYKQSTIHTSKHSSASTLLTSKLGRVGSPINDMYNYEQSRVNQLYKHRTNQQYNQSTSTKRQQIVQYQFHVTRELLIMVKCMIKSFLFLKEQGELPLDISASSILWQQKIQTQLSIPQVQNQHKKMLTTLTNKSQIDQCLSSQSYQLANFHIPKESLQQMLKFSTSKYPSFKNHSNQSESFNQIFQQHIQTANTILSNSYPSPQELTESFLQNDSLYNSLLFKLGIIVMELWLFYDNLINIRNKQSINDGNLLKSIKELVYSSKLDQSNYSSSNKPLTKVNWLSISQLLNQVEQSLTIEQSQRQAFSIPKRLFSLFTKVLRSLLNRSALQRRNAINLIQSSQFIQLTSKKLSLSQIASNNELNLIKQNKIYQFNNIYNQQNNRFEASMNQPYRQKTPMPYMNFNAINSQLSNIIYPNQTLCEQPRQNMNPQNYSLQRNQIVNQRTLQKNQQLLYRPLTSYIKQQQPLYTNNSFTPLKQGKQTIITQSISIIYQPSINTNPQILYSANKQLQPSKSLSDSSKFYTPSFAFGSQKTKQINLSMKESPKLPTVLFPSSTSDRNPKISSNQINSTYKVDERDSPVHNPQLHVQISNSESQPPSHLPQSSNGKINVNKNYNTLRQSSHYDNILIQDDQDMQSRTQIFESFRSKQINDKLIQTKNTCLQQSNNITKKQHCQTQQNPLQQSAQQSPSQQLQYLIEQYKGGGRYQGYVKSKKRNGYGKLYYHQGSHYEGEWLDDQMNGYGKLYYSNGQLAYQGNWLHDQFHGSGKVYNDNPTMLDDSFDYTNFNNLQQQWCYYEGQLQHDLKEGHGTIMLENGEWFEGQFHNDRINGQGKFVNLQSETIYGKWKDNIMIEMYES